jgi:hypothetical protein
MMRDPIHAGIVAVRRVATARQTHAKTGGSSRRVGKVSGLRHTLRMKITTKKIGGIWHGYLEGHPEVDERALTEAIARSKVERMAAKLHREETNERTQEEP